MTLILPKIGHDHIKFYHKIGDIKDVTENSGREGSHP